MRAGTFQALITSSLLLVQFVSPNSARADDHVIDTIQKQHIRRVGDAIFYQANPGLDLDGAPSAYSLANDGLDDICDAGLPYLGPGLTHQLPDPGGPNYAICIKAYTAAKTKQFVGPPWFNWFGILPDGKHKPMLQTGPGAIAGFFASPTSLRFPESTYGWTDQRSFVDSTKIAYVVLPPRLIGHGGDVGDVAAVIDPVAPDHIVFAIVGDVGNSAEIGETSLALQQALEPKHKFFKTRANGSKWAFFPIGHRLAFLVFTGSHVDDPQTHHPLPISQEEVDRRGTEALAAWGGAEKFHKLIKDHISESR